MQRKSNKKTTGKKGLADPAIQAQIEADFAKVTQSIKEKMELVKRFEDLLAMKITAGYCPGCKEFRDCTAMMHGQRFLKWACNLDYTERDALVDRFAKGLSVVEDLKPAPAIFSGN